ncbi:hypothetical protein Slala04_50560 [Streptomyces lavendulae subsp. lavendulae]|nr:hypothetical protein Slala04_50560 [Streptomyces lavendulae subsp. lavendulae]
MDLQGAPGPLPAGAPHLADDLFAAEDDAGPLREQGQQVELLAGEGYVGAVHADPAGGQLDADGAEADGGGRPGAGGDGLLGGSGAPGDGVDAGEELAGVVGLDDVVVGAHVQAVDAGAHVGPRGDHDDGRGGALADPAAHLVAVLVGQAEVEQDHAEGRGAGGQECLEGLFAVAGVGDLEAVPGEDRGQGGGDVVVVLDEQQSHVVPLSFFSLGSLGRPRARASVTARTVPHAARTALARPVGAARTAAERATLHPRPCGVPRQEGSGAARLPLCTRYAYMIDHAGAAHGAYPEEAGSLCSILPQM